MRCPNCGGALAARARFCDQCGSAVGARSAAEPGARGGGGAKNTVILLLVLGLAGAVGWILAEKTLAGRALQRLRAATFGEVAVSVDQPRIVAGAHATPPVGANPTGPPAAAAASAPRHRRHRASSEEETIAEDVPGEAPQAPVGADLPPPPPEQPAAPRPASVAAAAPAPAAAAAAPNEPLDGYLDPNQVALVVRHYYAQVRACYDRQLRNDPDVAGVVTMRFVVAPGGHLSRVAPTSNTTDVPQLGGCIANAMRSWQFPSPEGGSVEFEFPFRFGAPGQLPDGTQE